MYRGSYSLYAVIMLVNMHNVPLYRTHISENEIPDSNLMSVTRKRPSPVKPLYSFLSGRAIL